MKITSERIIEVGDKIRCQGVVAEIASIGYQFDDGEYLMCEFMDTKGNYRSWKQWCDGGELITKEN